MGFISVLTSVFMFSSVLTFSLTSIPSWTAVDEDGDKLLSAIKENGEVVELPTFEEEFAYLDYSSADSDMKELILEARRNIVYGNTSWSVDGQASIIRADGTEEKVPKFSELYPNWDLDEISKQDNSKIEENLGNALGNVSFSDNVDLPLRSNRVGYTFYTFNAGSTSAKACARTLPLNTNINIGLENKYTNKTVAWATNLKKNETLNVKTKSGERYGFFC